MISRKELINSKEYWLVKFQNALYAEVEKYLEENQISKTDFAKKMGVSKGYVSQILNGDFDHKLTKVIELCLAINKVPVIKIEDLEKYQPTTSFRSQPLSETKTVTRKPRHSLTKSVTERKKQTRRIHSSNNVH